MKAAGGLFDQIWERENLVHAAWRAARGKRNRPEVCQFLENWEGNLQEIGDELRWGRYEFAGYRAFAVRDTKSREIHAPSFRDRVVHHAIIAVLGPVMERGAIAHSYACRAGRGQHAALAQARTWTRRADWYGKGDVEKFYDSVDHGRLLRRLQRRFRETKVLDLWARVLDSYAVDAAGSQGLPIGALTSQYLGNFFLDAVDQAIQRTGKAERYLRYMDDMVVWGSQDDVREVRFRMADTLEGMGLRLKHGGEWNRCVRGVPMLGFVVYPDRMRLNRMGRKRLRRKLGAVERAGVRGWMDEREEQERVTALFAHAGIADDGAWRTMVLRLSPRGREEFGDGQGPAARESWRFVERNRQELPLGEPQQERSQGAQREPGLSSLCVPRHGGTPLEMEPPDDARSRSRTSWRVRDEATDKPPADPEIPRPERWTENGAAGAPGVQLQFDFHVS